MPPLLDVRDDELEDEVDDELLDEVDEEVDDGLVGAVVTLLLLVEVRVELLDVEGRTGAVEVDTDELDEFPLYVVVVRLNLPLDVVPTLCPLYDDPELCGTLDDDPPPEDDGNDTIFRLGR